MALLEIWGAVVVGIVLSILGPLLRKAVPTVDGREEGEDYWKRIKPYVALGAFSVLTGLLVVAILGDTLGQDWRTALVAGYAWDSTLQKAKG